MPACGNRNAGMKLFNLTAFATWFARMPQTRYQAAKPEEKVANNNGLQLFKKTGERYHS